ncbi:ABC transporter ATP-binding protein [Paenibacillus sp. N1-5-1-14]|uniref:ABC transporter ATP-binding protein n=1 Tax=Paenibacillus radicibacter TaxID=2972488 RepID=UPI00215998DD|nr:ABC transporter ATP-binding protein [Paenibacillus radicibacter]MCR8644969.1 ABC transporter ATP-binding protein [Paenibacillus radicibacter]
MLEVRGISKRYENDRGVRSIDFDMQRGEIVGFLGPNGAGKTTTMRMITGYLNPTAGSILIDGVSMQDQPKQVRRKIGYLPETPPLYPEMTVQSYLKFVADIRDVPYREQKQRIGDVVDRLGLQDREKQVIRSLSKGYKQRLGLAQAIIHGPDLLVLDEPTSGLDPKQIIEIRQLIRELGENHTVLLSTHILPEVTAICNRVLIINKGSMVLDGKPEELGQKMGEKFEVSLQVKGSSEAVEQAIGDIGYLTEPMKQDGEDTVRLRVASEDGSDIRESLFYRFAQGGYPILEMKRESLSLEEIFLQLTREDAKTEQVQGEAGEEETDQEALNSEGLTQDEQSIEESPSPVVDKEVDKHA